MDILKILGDQSVDVDCPNCEHTFSVPFSELSVEGNILQCPACQASIGVNHDESFDSEMEAANKALNDFEKELKKLGK